MLFNASQVSTWFKNLRKNFWVSTYYITGFVDCRVEQRKVNRKECPHGRLQNSHLWVPPLQNMACVCLKTHLTSVLAGKDLLGEMVPDLQYSWALLIKVQVTANPGNFVLWNNVSLKLTVVLPPTICSMYSSKPSHYQSPSTAVPSVWRAALINESGFIGCDKQLNGKVRLRRQPLWNISWNGNHLLIPGLHLPFPNRNASGSHHESWVLGASGCNLAYLMQGNKAFW